MLTAKAKIIDRQLEPDDETKFAVTVFNGSPAATAKAVRVFARLDGGPCSGVELSPTELEFGTIPPNGRATREFSLSTKKANPKAYNVKFEMKYDSSMPTHECDEEGFVVVPD